MNMRGIYNALHFKCSHTVTRKGAGVFVGDNDHFDTEASFSSSLDARSVKFFVFPDYGSGWPYLEYGV
jgi:hypothetical protein